LTLAWIFIGMFTLILFTRPQFGFSPLTFIEDGAKRMRELLLYYRMLYSEGYSITLQAVADAQKYVFLPFLEASYTNFDSAS